MANYLNRVFSVFCLVLILCYSYKFSSGFPFISCNASSENLVANQANVLTYWRMLLDVDHIKTIKGL